MSYSDLTLKKLFVLSGNECAFPGCTAPVLDTEHGVLVGQICHIRGKSPGGPRYDPNQTEDERDGYENLLVMCAAHNKIIDDEATRDQFPVEFLLEFKSQHERRSRNTVVKESIIKRLVESLQKAVPHPKVFIKSSKLYQPLGTSDRIEVEVWLYNSGEVTAIGTFSNISFRFDPSKPPIRLQYQIGAASINFDLAPKQDTYLRLASTLSMDEQMIKALNEGGARLYIFAKGSYSDEKGEHNYPLSFCRMYHPTMPGNLIHCPEDVTVYESIGQVETPPAPGVVQSKQRPSLVTEDMVITEFAAGKIISVDVTFRNTGQTPASNVTTHAVVWSEPVVDVDATCPELPPRPSLKFLSKSTVGTNGAIKVHVHTDKPITGAQFDAIQNRLFWLYVYAIAEYEGDGEGYFTEAYGRYDIVFRDFIKCDKHNQAN